MASITLSNTLLLVGAILVLIGVFSSLVAQRFGAPLLLVFLVIGMLAGQDGLLGLTFDDYQLTYMIGSLALAIILFDGGLRARFSRMRGAMVPAALLSTLGVIITAGVTAVGAWLLLPLNWPEALLVGAIVGSTDAAAVFFLLRAGGIQLRPRVAATLEVESGTNDPVAVFLTLVLVEILLAPGERFGATVLIMLAQQAVLGTLLGVAGGYFGVWLLNRMALPGGLHSLFVVSGAVFVFALASVTGGSGFLAVYLAGLVMGNQPVRAMPSIVSFHDTATWLAQIIMFLVLGLLVTPSELIRYLVPAIAVAAVLILIARPLAVWLCLAPFGFHRRDKTFIAWVGLRGAVSVFLAAIPMLSGVPNAEIFFNTAFFVVLISLLVQGWSIRTAARRLRVTVPRTTVPVRRVELDLPGQLDYEMVAYPIVEDSPVLHGRRLPPWVRPVFIIRENQILEPGIAGHLVAGDYAYFLAPPGRVERLDQVFAAPADQSLAANQSVACRGDASMGELADSWHLDIGDDVRALTVGEWLAHALPRPIRPGDQLIIDHAWLVVSDVDGEEITRVELFFRDPMDGWYPQAMKHPRLGPPIRAFRRWLDRRR